MGNTTTTSFADDDFCPGRTLSSAAAAKTTAPRKQIPRRRRLSRRRLEHYFRAVKVLAAEQQPHFSFSPFCYVSRASKRETRGRGVENTREKKSKKYTNTHTHTHIILIKERFEIQRAQIQCLSYGATIECTRRKRDARVCAEVLCEIR